VKVDRMSMAHSLESRVPFLDRAVMEFSRRIPRELRLHGLTTKYLLKRAMATRLPASVVGGKKRGFNVPMPGWLAGELREFMQDTLSPSRLRAQGIFDPAAVGRLMEQHVRREVDHSRALWTLLVFATWMDDVLGVGRQAAARAVGGAA
jgi:asparagine synthase (glutamine-hydrolysing)